MKRVLLLSAGMFALGLDAYVLSGVLTGISGSLHVSVGAAGQIVTAFTLSYALLSPVLATLSATWPRRRLLIGALALFSAANIVSATAPSLGVLIAARIVAGAGAGLYAPAAATSAAALVPPDKRARALGLCLGGLTTATVLGVPIGTAVGTHLGWRVTMILVVAVGAAAALLVALFLPRVTSVAHPPGLRTLVATLAHRKVGPLIGLIFLMGVAMLGLYTYLGTVLVTHIGVSRNLLPLYFMLWGVSGIVGNLTVSHLIDRGRRPLTVLTAVIVLCCLSMLALHLAGSVTVLLVLIGYGVAGGSVQVPLQHRLLDVAEDRGPVAVALFSAGLYLGVAVGAALGAVALRSAGASWLGPLAAVPVAGALLIALTLARQQAKAIHREHPDTPGAAAHAAAPECQGTQCRASNPA